MDKLTIWIYGAGAVGAYYGAKLLASGHDVLFIARGTQLKALQEDGLTIKTPQDSQTYKVTACLEDDLDKHSQPNLVIVATKRPSNQAIAQKLKNVLKKATPVYVFQNGLKSEEIFEETLGKESIFRAVVNLAAKKLEPGKIFQTADSSIFLPEGSYSELLASSFKQEGVGCKVKSNIKKYVWQKLVWNASFNPVTALTRQSTGPILEDTEGYKLIENICNEVVLLAALNGITLDEDTTENTIKSTKDIFKNITTSTREDVLAGRKPEYNAIVGDLIEEADSLKQEIPYLRTVATLLKLLQTNN